MAYMAQERKKLLAPGIKSALAKHGLKGTIGVENHSTLRVTITAGSIDFIENWLECLDNNSYDYHTKEQQQERAATVRKTPCIQVNQYHIDRFHSGRAATALNDILAAMRIGHYDNSNAQIDYFDCAFYISLNIGRWNKPYAYVK